jgi:hypothetical protein
MILLIRDFAFKSKKVNKKTCKMNSWRGNNVLISKVIKSIAIMSILVKLGFLLSLGMANRSSAVP